MSKQGKINNSTILLIGLLIIIAGVVTGVYEYFQDRKDKTYSAMNILLFESEQPENILGNIELDEDIEQDEDIEIDSDINTEDDTPNNENNEAAENDNKETDKKPVEKYLGVLEIPKINLKRGFYDINYKYNKVNYNITVIKGSTYPGTENNNLILAAHSGNCTVCYFDKLYKLGINDTANLYYGDVKYSYKVVNIYEVEKDGTVEIHRNYSKNCLTLITCTRNSNTKQTVYILEQI